MVLLVYCVVTAVLTTELVVATDQCTEYRFKSPFYPGKSCEDIYNNNVEIRDNSGYYRINSSHWTYCDMIAIISDFTPSCAGIGGGWRRIANIDVSTGDNCPSGWRRGNYSGVSFCVRVSDDRGTCSSANFSTNGTSYQRVCGRARGYQKGYTNGFHGYQQANQPIDGYYVAGLSITYGTPRQHIWTYAAGVFDNITHSTNCPCAEGGGLAPPPFVGTNYYCESGNTNQWNTSAYFFNDPLWDGSGCITSRCCDNPMQPWFYRELNGITTNDIEARICGSNGFNGGTTLIDQLQLYIQ